MRHLLTASLLLVVGTTQGQQALEQRDPASYSALKQQGAIVAERPAIKHYPRPLAGRPAMSADVGVAKGGNTNVCDCWIQPDGSYTLAMPPNDDQSSAEIQLPFSYNLYGQLFNSVYINNNGNISFDAPYFTFSSDPFPSAGFVMVAPFWADVHTTGAGQVWYKVTPTALYVNWVGVGYFLNHTDKLNTFQLIITDGNDPVIGIGKNTSFCYQDMQWTTGDASSGVNGFGGTPATVGANLGNGVDYIQFGRFDQAGTAYDGPFGANDGVSWLDYQNLVFNTDVFTSNIPPIGSGDYLCDTVRVCAGEQVTLSMQFLSPESDQVTTATASAPSFSNFTETVNIPGQTAQITGVFTPLPAEAGFHVVTFQATDNGAPNLTATYNIVVEVELAASMEPGALTVCSTDLPVDMYSLLGGTPIPGGTWSDPGGNDVSGTFLPGESVDGPYVYAVGNGGNCPNTGVVTMTTAQAVDAGTDAVVTYCTSDGAVDLFPLLGGTPQNTGSWSAPGGTPTNATFDPATEPGGTYTYTVTAAAPCPTETATVQVTLQQAVDPGQDATVTLCTNAPLFSLVNGLNGNPDAGGTWSAPGGGGFGNTFSAVADAPGTYTYTVAAVAPCPDLSAQLTIAVDPLPYAGEDGAVTTCADGTGIGLFGALGNDPDNGGTWTAPGGAQHDGTLEAPTDPAGPYVYTVNGLGACNSTSDAANVVVTINPLPIVRFTVAPESGCAPLDVSFTNTTDPAFLGGTCTWNLGDGTNNVAGCGTLSHTYTQSGWYNVTLSITTPQGCTDQTTLEGAVLVEEPPTAEFTWTPPFGTDRNGTLLFTAEDPQATVFRWDFAGLDSSTTRQAAHTFPNAIDGAFEVCLWVADSYGCTDSLCRMVEVIVPAVYVPNAFTPDGNGVNDAFRPIVRGMAEEDHQFTIFDRWGQVVFDSTNPLEGWNGSYRNGGEVLPQGVYSWRLIERPFGTPDKKDWFGSVTLLK
jgi:gliding motility-associated-like protein